LFKILSRRNALDLTCPSRRFEFLAKILELFEAHIADGAQIETLLGPELDVEALHGLGTCYTGYSVTPKTVKYGAGATARKPSGPATPKTRMRTIWKPMFP
jgi:hypothetical protein